MIKAYRQWLSNLQERNWYLGEAVSQAIDQSGHFLWAWVGVALGIYIGGTIGSLIAVVNTAYIAYREYGQWPSSRWWDPPLDFMFYAGGILFAIFGWPAI